MTIAFFPFPRPPKIYFHKPQFHEIFSLILKNIKISPPDFNTTNINDFTVIFLNGLDFGRKFLVCISQGNELKRCYMRY